MKKFHLFGSPNIRTFFKELVLTLTNNESRFSQKKILIYVIDFSMLVTTLLYVHHRWALMTSGDLTMIVGMWLAKGTTNVMMSQTDKKIAMNAEIDKESEANDESKPTNTKSGPDGPDNG